MNISTNTYQIAICSQIQTYLLYILSKYEVYKRAFPYIVNYDITLPLGAYEPDFVL
jgi:hypothetical protein